MAASSTDIEEFLSGPLVTWLATCVKNPESLQIYETFFDGSPFSEVLLQIDPEPSQPIPTSVNVQGLSITAARIKIFHCILKNIKTIYEEELGQIVVSLPDCVTLGRAPASDAALHQLKLLLLLVLGCAVQGPTKEHFITKIKALPLDAQHDIVECIKQVTDNQTIVLTHDWTEQAPQRLYTHIQTLTSERDKLLQQWIADLGQESRSSGGGATEDVESNHIAVAMADWKARLRKQRQELEEKSELLTECREELEHANSLLSKLKTENADLVAEARRAKAYRDELDAARERAEKAERLEIEIQRYREKLADAEFYRARVDELREDNRVLLETREMLETQLSTARSRADQVLELESELMTSKKIINEVVLERDAAKAKIQELLDENFELQNVTKSAFNDTSLHSIDSDQEEQTSGDNSLSEQLTNSAQARALKLELENKKLLQTIDNLKERSFKENSEKLLELEKERKKLSLNCEQLQQNCERLTQQNVELENLFKNAIQENRILQNNLDALKIQSDRQSQDIQSEKIKTSDLEKTIESLKKEKERALTLCNTIKNRADDSDRTNSRLNEIIEDLKTEVNIGKQFEQISDDLKEKVTVLEKDNNGLQKEVLKLKETIEVKDILLDEHNEQTLNLKKDIEFLTKENLELNTQLEKMLHLEKEVQDLTSQLNIHSETIANLKKDLIAEKINSEKIKTNIEKLGLNVDVIENDINAILEKMLENSDVMKVVTEILRDQEEFSSESTCKSCSEMNSLEQQLENSTMITKEINQRCEKLTSEIANLQHQNDSLQKENAGLQVNVSMLKSQVGSLQTQQTALQLANSQLVAEKEDLSKQNAVQKSEHETLLLDQVTLRTIHEQLTTEYDKLLTEQEMLKKSTRDLRNEVRNWKEKCESLENNIKTLEQEKENLNANSSNLINLRAEHSKLKDDFRNLFTASERLKIEYKSVQEELKKLRTESRVLRLGQTEMQGELNSRTDLVTGFQLENAKLQQKCDMLYEMNQSLDSDRRALMEHVSQLLTQYHSLLTTSLEDKEHFHLEEKMFTDKLNNLCRQKEKLEEKIMEHYKRLDNVTSKKGGFATLVKRVRKAGSDIINKVPRSNRRSWQEDTPTKSSATPPIAQNSSTPSSGEPSNGSNGNESDNSIEDSIHRDFLRRTPSGSLHGQRPRDEVALRRSHRDMSSHRNSIASEQLLLRDTNSALSLGSIGSRRTVYISEEETPSIQPTTTSTLPARPAVPQNGTAASPNLLVYNRISTVIGDHSLRTLGNQTNLPEEYMRENAEKKKTNSKETAVWYEYGCV